MGNICLPQQKKSTVEVITGCGVRTQLTLFEQINDANRLEKWISVFQISEEDMNPHHCELSYKVANKMVFKNLVIDYTTYPSFGTDIQWEIFPQLTEEMKTSAIRLFYLISEMNGLYFAPQLPYFTIILLHYYSEEIVYSIISSILGNGELRKRFFILNQRYQESFIEQVNEINQRLGNPVNKSFSTQHSSIYGYIVRSWMNSVFLTSLQPFQFARLFDAYIEVGIWLFPAFYVTFLNRYAGELLPLLNEENEEDNCFIVQSHIQDLTDDELELLLLNSIYLTTSFQNEDQEIQDRMTMMIKRIDEGEDIMNICKYHLYYVMGPSRLLTSSLCKEIMKILPVRVQSQDPHLLYTSIIHGYHLTHLLEKASFYKPTLLLCQIEHSGNLIGFYREDRWSHRQDAHGSSDSILLLIEFYSRHGEIETRIQKWDGGKMISDQFIDGVSHPTKYVYARSPGNYLMIGAGGKKGISFYSSEDYLKASSHSSDVFQNPPLCDKEFFSISNVELFHFVSPGSNYNVSFKQTKYHTG